MLVSTSGLHVLQIQNRLSSTPEVEGAFLVWRNI